MYSAQVASPPLLAAEEQPLSIDPHMMTVTTADTTAYFLFLMVFLLST